MTDITIPPEALEAAARAICETENGPCKCMPDECGCIYWKAHATAALRAGIAAWPGIVKNYSWDASHGRIILPLFMENTNAEG
jgi:hypothetical protein